MPELDDAVLDIDVPEGGGAVVDVSPPGVGQVQGGRQQPVRSADGVLLRVEHSHWSGLSRSSSHWSRAL